MKEIFITFIRLGMFAFGGPAAHIALLHKEVVENKKWISNEHFLDLVGATSLIPGPNSTEMVIHCGYHRGGVKGLFLAGVSFILPASLMTGILAYLYVKYSSLPNFENYLIGIKCAVLFLILSAILKLFPKAVKKSQHYILFFVSLGVLLSGVQEIIALFVCTFFGFLLFKGIEQRSLKSVEPISILLVFLKVGSILFGSGYVLIGYLQSELIDKHQYITMGQLADAIGIGQVTPGPVLSTSTFIGYLMGHTPGAILATIGIFLPSFIFVWILASYIPKMRSSKSLGIVLDSVNIVSVAVMCSALIPVGKIAIQSVSALLSTLIIGGIYFSFKKLNPIIFLIISCIIGFIFNYLL